MNNPKRRIKVYIYLLCFERGAERAHCYMTLEVFTLVDRVYIEHFKFGAFDPHNLSA